MGTYLDEDGACVSCPIGRYTDVDKPPWPTNCTWVRDGHLPLSVPLILTLTLTLALTLTLTTLDYARWVK